MKSKVGLAVAKAAALRVNLNVNGCSIVARSSRSSRACLTDSAGPPREAPYVPIGHGARKRRKKKETEFDRKIRGVRVISKPRELD